MTAADLDIPPDQDSEGTTQSSGSTPRGTTPLPVDSSSLPYESRKAVAFSREKSTFAIDLRESLAYCCRCGASCSELAFQDDPTRLPHFIHRLGEFLIRNDRQQRRE